MYLRKNRKKCYEKFLDCPFMPSMITSNATRLANCKTFFDALIVDDLMSPGIWKYDKKQRIRFWLHVNSFLINLGLDELF